MAKVMVDVFSDERNNSVVHLPDTQYLGSVIQGDSLFLLHADAIDIIEELKHSPGSYGFYKAYAVAKSLELRLDHYITTCKKHGVELNFMKEISIFDYDEPL
jgi:hypothetical protein